MTQKRKGLSGKTIRSLVKKQDWIYTEGGRDWRDGLLLGNGDLAAVAYVPGHFEWVINKVDVFDPTTEQAMVDKIIPHDEFLRRIQDMNPKHTWFLNELEFAPTKGKRLRDTMSAAVVRLSFWQGIGWSAPPMPKTTSTLCLYDAVLEERADFHNMHITLRSFIPRGRETFCLRLRGSERNMSPNILELVRPADSRLDLPVWHSCGNSCAAFTQKLPGGRHHYTLAVAIVPNEKRTLVYGKPEERSMVLEQSGDADIFITVKTSFRSKNTLKDALRELTEITKISFDTLEQEHKKWWHGYWNKKAFADFGKYTGIQKYYTFGLYEIASVYGRAPMPGLNGMAYGPLNERIPGVGVQGYTHDQNAQIPAMAFLPSNRVDLIEVVADTYLNAEKELKKYTRKLFACDGICLPGTGNQLGLVYPTRAYRYTHCCGAYTGMVLSFAWRYSRDVKLLKNKLYPLLREFVIFYSNLMSLGEDGIYHLDWTVPPEIFTLTRDELATLSMLKVCLETVIEGAKILKCDAKRLKQWKDILEHYPSIPTRPDGAFWCGPDVPLNHFFYGGHTLYPFFPAAISNDLRAVRKTLDFIENESVERSFADRKGEYHMNHDWSAFIITATYLRVGDRAKGWKGVNRFLELFGKENGLFSHDPILIGNVAESEANERKNVPKRIVPKITFTGKAMSLDDPNISHAVCVTENPDAKRMAPSVLEGSSAFVFLASETLLQSHGGIIRLFPGVPNGFTGSFHSFLAEGAFEISSEMKNGKILYVRIKSLCGGSLRLANKGNMLLTLKKNECFETDSGLMPIV